MDNEIIEKRDKIVNWMKQKVSESGASGAVIGLSGGIDSSVVAALAKLALGENVLGVIMPCESIEEDSDHAHLLAEKLNINTEFIDLGNVFNSLRHSLPAGEGLAVANMKPRLRMTALYYFANTKNFLVLGTGNRSELLQSYFTKYGDGGADLLPIGKLYKKEVYELARTLNIPIEIIEKPASAGLWPGQTDEDEMGISYDKLDSILRLIFDKKIEYEEVAHNLNIDIALVKKVMDRYEKGKHKLSLPKMPDF